MKESNDLVKSATNSANLLNRSDINKKLSKYNFEEWTTNLIDSIKFKSILDVCCGTGNQLIHYLNKTNVKLIVGVDISQESLDIAATRINTINKNDTRIILKQIAMEEMFSNKDLQHTYDLISCFYGLYYSRNVRKTLNEMLDHLNNNGVILIVGPHGKNNELLFNILKRYYQLPELVYKSSTSFMQEEVLPELQKNCYIEQKYFINYVCFPDTISLYKYWKSTTFYSKDYDKRVLFDFTNYFQENKEFVLEKHVMAIIARKK